MIHLNDIFYLKAPTEFPGLAAGGSVAFTFQLFCFCVVNEVNGKLTCCEEGDFPVNLFLSLLQLTSTRKEVQ